MATMIVGLFDSPSDYKKVEKDLEANGFGNDEYIVFIVKNSDDHDFMVTTKVAGDAEIQKATEVYESNQVKKIYDFHHMSWEDATYETFKQEIRTRAKFEIKEIRNLNVKDPSHGISTEVKSSE